jgi:hypothetical protein
LIALVIVAALNLQDVSVRDRFDLYCAESAAWSLKHIHNPPWASTAFGPMHRFYAARLQRRFGPVGLRRLLMQSRALDPDQIGLANQTYRQFIDCVDGMQRPR